MTVVIVAIHSFNYT